MRQCTPRIVESEFEFRLWHLPPGGVLVWSFGSKSRDEPLPASVSMGNAPRKSQRGLGKWDHAGKEPGRGAMRNNVPEREGAPLAQFHWELWGQCPSHLRVPLSRTRGLGQEPRCTPHSQVKDFPRRSKPVGTPGAPVVGKVDAGSLRAVVPQRDPGAG